MTNEIHVRRSHKVFVVPETTKGTLVVPAAGNYIIPVGLAMLNQTPSFTNSEEIQDTLDVTDRFQDRMPAGTWNISCYLRPSGTAGTAPQGDSLLEALLGTKTVVGGTSVTYSQAIEKPSVSIWIMYDNTVRFMSGCTVDGLNLQASNKGAAQADFSGQGMKSGTVGTQDLAVAITASDTTFEVDDASCYSVGGLVEFYDVSADTVDDNSSAGYAITGVNTSTNIVTVGSEIGSGFAINDTVRPFLPTGTEVGSPVENRKTSVSVNTVSTNIKSLSLSAGCPASMLEDEITTSGYVEDYVPDMRNISGSLSLLMRNNDAKYFVDNYDGSEVPIVLTLGEDAGSIVTVTMSRCSLDVPSVSDSNPTVSLDMNYLALGTSGEDSLTVAFT